MRKILLGAVSLSLAVITTNAQKKWMPAGVPGFSAGITAYTSMAVDKNNVKYIAYLDGSAGARATVMKYTGANWQPVGITGFSTPISTGIHMAVDTNDTPYIVYSDDWAGTSATVMKYDGANWVKVGNGISTGQAMYPSITFDNANTPYVTYRDVAGGYTPAVKKYDGANWVTVGDLITGTTNSDNISLAINKNNVPYLAYGSGQKVWVMKYDDTAWVPVNTSGISPGIANATFLAFDSNDTLYLGVVDGSNGNKGTVYKYIGSGWVMVGGSPLSESIGAFALDKNGTPYVGYKSGNNGPKAEVIKFDGTSWVAVGSSFAYLHFVYMDMVIDQNVVPYVSYTDFWGGRATVMKYDDCPPHPAVGICAVTTDTTTGNNIIVWNGLGINYVDSYRIYREDSGSYAIIGSTSGANYSFTDTSANSSLQSYRYKLTVWDSCERETDIDSVVTHKPVKLAFNYLLNNTASISWNSYEGIHNPIYIIRRSNNGGTFVAVDSFSISGPDTTCLDNNPPSGGNRYRIDIALIQPCSTDSGTYDKITSNIVTSWHTGVGEAARGKNIMVMPNPVADDVVVRANSVIEKIEVYTLTGKILMVVEGINKIQATINASNLPAGVYVLRVNGTHHMRFAKQ